MREVINHNLIYNTAMDYFLSDLKLFTCEQRELFSTFSNKACEKENNHSHQTSLVKAISNGQITNHSDLRSLLESNGYLFESDDESECLVQLLSFFLDADLPIENALVNTINTLEGDVSFMLIFEANPDQLYMIHSSSEPTIEPTKNTYAPKNNYDIQVVDAHNHSVIKEISNSHTQVWNN